MTTITLVEHAVTTAQHIHTMRAIVPGQPPQPIVLNDLAGGPIQFTCTNAQNAVQGATSVEITYDASIRDPIHQNIQISSVHA